MSADIGPGDVVVCVDAHSPSFEVVNVASNARLRRFLVRGRHYRVTDCFVYQERLWLELQGQPCFGGFDANRFRKLNDGEDDAELIARIKSCKPVREGVAA